VQQAKPASAAFCSSPNDSGGISNAITMIVSSGTAVYGKIGAKGQRNYTDRKLVGSSAGRVTRQHRSTITPCQFAAAKVMITQLVDEPWFVLLNRTYRGIINRFALSKC
jgi:hypothetical protein